MDFIHDRLADGRSFRTLNLTECFTRQCLGQELDTSLSGVRVVRLLEQTAQKHRLPKLIQVDNGPEFRSKVLDLWAYQNKVKLDPARWAPVEPGKPTQSRARQAHPEWPDREFQRTLSRRVSGPGVVRLIAASAEDD